MGLLPPLHRCTLSPSCHGKVDVMWHDHDLGSYATVGLRWDAGVRSDAPWDYINWAEQAISRLDDAVDFTPTPGGDDDGEEEEEGRRAGVAEGDVATSSAHRSTVCELSFAATATGGSVATP